MLLVLKILHMSAFQEQRSVGKRHTKAMQPVRYNIPRICLVEMPESVWLLAYTEFRDVMSGKQEAHIAYLPKTSLSEVKSPCLRKGVNSSAAHLRWPSR